jgi:putative membrane protein
MTTLFAFLHHVAAFTLVSALAVELVLLRQELTLAVARRLPIVDAVLGVSAGILLVVGLLRVFYFEKGADYYFHSHAFLTKLSIFIAVGLLSIIPSVEFLSWRKDVRKGQVPAVTEQKLRFLRKVIRHSWRVDRSRHYPSVCRHNGSGRLGVANTRSGGSLWAAASKTADGITASGWHKRRA